MYGTGVGTGAAGGGLFATGVATGSYILALVALVFLLLMAFGLLRYARRTQSHQRP